MAADHSCTYFAHRRAIQRLALIGSLRAQGGNDSVLAPSLAEQTEIEASQNTRDGRS